MTSVLATAVQGPGVWRGAEMARNGGWIRHFEASELDELNRAVAAARNSGKPLFEMTRDDFPLPTLGPRLVALRDEIEGGRGFQLLRGLRPDRFSHEECRILAWGLANHIGSPEPQDKRGSLMHDITDTGRKVEGSESTRGFETNDELNFHNDGGDAFMLFCLRTAVAGGVSKLVSVGALFNEVLARCPDLAEVLQQPFHFDARAQGLEEGSRCQVVPVFNSHRGHLSALYKRRYIETAQRFEEVPRLTEQQVAALDLLDAICADPAFQLSFEMQPGDIQIGNNYAVLHSRTRYQDHEDAARKRHLLRIWLTLPNGRPLPEVFGRTREFGPAYARRMAA